MLLGSVFFRDIRQRRVVILFRRLGNLSVPWSRFKKYKKATWPLKMGAICCPEKSVQNYNSTLRNIPEERIFQVLFCTELVFGSVWNCPACNALLVMKLPWIKLPQGYLLIEKEKPLLYELVALTIGGGGKNESEGALRYRCYWVVSVLCSSNRSSSAFRWWSLKLFPLCEEIDFLSYQICY